MPSVYFDLLADASESTETIKLNALSMKRLLLGELEQKANTYNINITFKQYLRSIKGKTAQLFELSCFEGASWGKANPEVIEKSSQIGHYIGITFQILDDILDYSQTSEAFAKPVLEDVKQGVYSLPLILAIQENKQAFIPLLSKRTEMTPADIEQIVSLIEHYHGLKKAHEIAEYYTKKALGLITQLPECSEKEILYQLTLTLLNRNF